MEYTFADVVKVLMKLESKVDGFGEKLTDQCDRFAELLQRVDEKGKAVAVSLKGRHSGDEMSEFGKRKLHSERTGSGSRAI